MSIHRNRKPDSDHSPEQEVKITLPTEFLWAVIGLLLTIFSTFAEAFVTNPPWQWGTQGVQPQSLGVTYQVGAVLLTGCMGGKNAGAWAQIAYVMLGLLWFPIFAHGGGTQYLVEPSFGYILGFIPAAWLCGFLAFRQRAKLESLALSALCGLGIIHLCGLLYLIGLFYLKPVSSQITNVDTLWSLIYNYSFTPLVGQLVIICVVAVVAFILRKILFY